MVAVAPRNTCMVVQYSISPRGQGSSPTAFRKRVKELLGIPVLQSLSEWIEYVWDLSAIIKRNVFCLFVCFLLFFLPQSRIFHSFGEVTINGEALPVLGTYGH